MDHDQAEFLLAVGMTAELQDGVVCRDVAWKHCADDVLRFYKTDGMQITGIQKLSGGAIVVPLQVLTYCKTHCVEER